MENKQTQNFKIIFKEKICNEISSEFSKLISGELIEHEILLFDQWGDDFCDGFIDIEDYKGKIKPKNLLYDLIKSSVYYSKIKETEILLDDNGLEHKIFQINEKINIEINLPIKGGLSVYYTLTESEKNEYEKEKHSVIRDKITDMKENYSKYKVISWR